MWALRSALGLALLAVPAPLAAQDVSALTDEQREALVASLREGAAAGRQAPMPFVTMLLREHDVVLLGEQHGIRQTSAFVAASLARLYHDAGLRVFATEFLRHRFTAAANALVTADAWNEAAMIELMRQGPWPTWGYRGHLEIYAAIWRLNHTLRAEGDTAAPPLELVGLDSDWSQYELWFGDMDARARFDVQLARERTMVAAVRQHGLEPDKKTLVHVGFAHSVTCHGLRLGTVLSKEYPGRIAQIGIHHALQNSQRAAPLSALIEDVHGTQACAFAVRGTPFGALRDSRMPYARALPNGTFGDLAQHWLYLAPVTQQEPERWIEGFVTDATFAQAERICVRLGFVREGQCKNAGELDAVLAERYPTEERRERTPGR